MNYPHQGLIGHIVDHHYDEYPWLDPQCFLLELAEFSEDDFTIGEFNSINTVRSDVNIHDEYTPLWLRPGTIRQQYAGTFFGQRLIARIVNNGKMVSNWVNKLRANKFFLYNDEQLQKWVSYNTDYCELAENQLWIFNNEPMPVDHITKDTVICPASGVFWMLAASRVSHIYLVDISSIQITFVQELLDTWDGQDYGQFVIDFMERHNVVHYNLDKEIDKIQRLKFNNRQSLRDYVNAVYSSYNVNWPEVKRCTFGIYNIDVINYLSKCIHTVSMDIWLSNILEYKYTLLTNTAEEINDFCKKLDDYGITRL